MNFSVSRVAYVSLVFSDFIKFSWLQNIISWIRFGLVLMLTTNDAAGSASTTQYVYVYNFTVILLFRFVNSVLCGAFCWIWLPLKLKMVDVFWCRIRKLYTLHHVCVLQNVKTNEIIWRLNSDDKYEIAMPSCV